MLYVNRFSRCTLVTLLLYKDIGFVVSARIVHMLFGSCFSVYTHHRVHIVMNLSELVSARCYHAALSRYAYQSQIRWNIQGSSSHWSRPRLWRTKHVLLRAGNDMVTRNKIRWLGHPNFPFQNAFIFYRWNVCMWVRLWRDGHYDGRNQSLLGDQIFAIVLSNADTAIDIRLTYIRLKLTRSNVHLLKYAQTYHQTQQEIAALSSVADDKATSSKVLRLQDKSQACNQALA